MGDLGKLIVAKGFEKLPKVQKIAQSGHTAGVGLFITTTDNSSPMGSLQNAKLEKISTYSVAKILATTLSLKCHCFGSSLKMLIASLYRLPS